MSAFGSKADMTRGQMSAFAVAIGVKRTWVGALHMSASDPKRTFDVAWAVQDHSGERALFKFHDLCFGVFAGRTLESA